jgi:hypothetical protein
MDKNEEYLRLLSIFHYIVGGMTMLFACFPILHLAMGLMLLLNPSIGNGKPEDAMMTHFMGIFFVVFALVIILVGWTLGICIIIAGKKIAKRINHTFCIVMAGIECIFMPFGTILGVFTLVLLLKEEVKALFH